MSSARVKGTPVALPSLGWRLSVAMVAVRLLVDARKGFADG